MEIDRAVLQQATTPSLERLARSLGLQVVNKHGEKWYRKALIAAILATIGSREEYSPLSGYMR